MSFVNKNIYSAYYSAGGAALLVPYQHSLWHLAGLDQYVMAVV